MTVSASDSATTTEITRGSQSGYASRLSIITAIIIFLLGAGVRLIVDFGFKGTGFDEALYRNYIQLIDQRGFTQYPEICQSYIEDQKKPDSIAKLPPTRFLYIFFGWTAQRLTFGNSSSPDTQKPRGPDEDPALISLHRVSLLFSILMVGLCGVAAWRMAGPEVGLGVLALVAASPLSIHMGKHALVDGFFAFWATLCLWLLWENLKRPNDYRWLTALGASLGLLVMTKENSFFVYISLAGIVLMNRWAKFGVVTKKLLIAGILGPAIGFITLVMLAGGIGSFIEIYTLLVTKAQNLEYAKSTGDGPWFRYLLELIIIDPIVFILAMTGVFTLPRSNRAFGYLIAFVIFSYVIMCNVRYAMNLRYTTIWALPLAALAGAQIIHLVENLGRHARTVAGLVVVGICAFNISQYHLFFVKFPIYEPVPAGTLQAVKILKLKSE